MRKTELKRKTQLKRSNLNRKPKKPSERKWGDFTSRRFNTKKDYVKALQTKAESLWKRAGKLLHGDECEVKKNFPQLNVSHSPVIQGEHCFKRGIKQLFLDINNHSSACSTCNQQKMYGNEKVIWAINQIVRNRNPEWFDQAIETMLSCQAENNFGQVWYLEEQIQKLLDIIDRCLNQEIYG